jgi:transposase
MSAFSKPCTSDSMLKARSTGICGASTVRPCGQAVLPPGLPKKCRRHAEEPKDRALGRSRGGFGSKFLLVTDGRGLPLTVEVTAGQAHESTCVESVMDQIAIPQPLGRPRKRPKRLAGDKGYSNNCVRDWIRRYGIKPLIPRKENEKLKHDGRSVFDKQTYWRRSIVEQTIGWLKECRRIGMRFEKLAINFLAMMQLAMIQRCLKMAFSGRA